MTTIPRLPFDDSPAPDPLGRDAAARRAAVDPSRNVVLEASAGTGKTRVLVDRYLNLLEAGVEPANILAMTFTRKAAAEMRQRIIARLRGDAALSPAHAARWRSLRERLGDVALTTIDAFCLLLLREFPLEADADPGFAVADETDTARAATAALDRVIPIARRLACSDPDAALVLARLDERQLRAGLASLLARRLVVSRILRRASAACPSTLTLDAVAEAAVDRLLAAFATSAGGLAGFLAGGPHGHPRFSLLAHDLDALARASRAGTESPGGLERAPLDLAVLEATLHLLRRYFLTTAGQPRRRLASQYGRDLFGSTEAFRRHGREVARLAPMVAGTLERAERDLNGLVTRGLSRLFRVTSRVYVQELEAASVLDFTELLRRALAVLARMDEFSQSRYRLESRYHHLLVDEFQDTSAPQWRLVSLLVRSWGEGQGLAHDHPLAPSIFVVGDRKQSIYGFRDADVTILGRARRFIQGLRAEGRVRRTISRSFRASPALQAFANDLFGAVDAAPGRRDRFRFGPRDRFPEPIDEQALPSPDERSVPLGISVGEDVAATAGAVADEIARLLGGEATVRDRASGLARGARPGDVAILFRSRESHAEYAQALEARSIPCYVYKGLGFFEAEEVRDVLALVRYLAEPSSELRAAAFLRSGFVRLSDRGLQALAGRLAASLVVPAGPPPVAGGGDTIALDAAGLDADDRRAFEVTRRSLASWLPLADRLPPAALIDRILAESAYAWELRGRRLAQARENLKKVRALVRRIQNRGYATLPRVAAHLRQLSTGDDANAVVDALDAVNLMTIHAAKGLEFPVVFLVNLARGSGGRRAAIRASDDPPIVAVGDFASAADDDLRDREREETKRLLYVAATRARDHLYFAAAVKDGELRPANGSLAQVLPASFRDLLAAARPDSEARLAEWEGPTGRRHVFRVLPPAGPPAKERDRGPGATAASDEFTPVVQSGRGGPAVFDAFEPLSGSLTAERVTVTELISNPAGDPGPPLLAPLRTLRLPPATAPGDETEEAERSGDADEVADAVPTPELDRAIGQVVHRLLQWNAGQLTAPPDHATLERQAAALLAPQATGLQPGEPGDLPVDGPNLVHHAVATCARLLEWEELRPLFATADYLAEVPFSLLAGGRVIRGTIDGLLRHQDGSLTVLEVKTGEPRPEHERQLAYYLHAAGLLFPGVACRGLLVYAGLSRFRRNHRPTADV